METNAPPGQLTTHADHLQGSHPERGDDTRSPRVKGDLRTELQVHNGYPLSLFVDMVMSGAASCDRSCANADLFPRNRSLATYWGRQQKGGKIVSECTGSWTRVGPIYSPLGFQFERNTPCPVIDAKIVTGHSTIQSIQSAILRDMIGQIFATELDYIVS
jgi:hypothetical protein